MIYWPVFFSFIKTKQISITLILCSCLLIYTAQINWLVGRPYMRGAIAKLQSALWWTSYATSTLIRWFFSHLFFIFFNFHSSVDIKAVADSLVNKISVDNWLIFLIFFPFVSVFTVCLVWLRFGLRPSLGQNTPLCNVHGNKAKVES